MLAIRTKSVDEIRKSVRRRNPNILFLTSSFNAAFLGMSELVIEDASVPVYNFPHVLRLLQTELKCDTQQARMTLISLLQDYKDRGRLCPIFVTVMEPIVNRQENPIFRAALEEYAFDSQTVVKLKERV